MAAAAGDASEELGEPRVLFKSDFFKVSGVSYAVFPRGDRFLVMKGGDESPPESPLRIVVNWFEELSRLARAQS